MSEGSPENTPIARFYTAWVETRRWQHSDLDDGLALHFLNGPQ